MILTVILKALFDIFIAVLQQLEGNLIYPKVVGSSIGLREFGCLRLLRWAADWGYRRNAPWSPCCGDYISLSAMM